MINRTPVRHLIATAAVAVATFAGAGAAQAQSDGGWLWGGSATPNSSGREVVRFSPQHPAGQVIVSFGDRRLYLVTRPGEALSYPIAIPREQSRWQGVTSVSSKRINPSWTPTPTMRAENPRLPMWVPGGHPMNPLGIRALYLGSSTYRIHGTDAPWTIGSAVSKGCIRMYNQDVVDLYPRVNVGAKVIVTWATFKGGVAQSAPVPEEPMARERPERRPYKRVASADAAATGSALTSHDAYPSASDDERPRRRYATAKKAVAKKVAPKVTSAESVEQ